MAKALATILAISDLHVGPMADGLSPEFIHTSTPLNKSEPRITKLVQALKGTEFQPDHLFVLGDLTSSAEPSEFFRSREIIQLLAEDLDIDSRNTLHIFGNHDVNWRISRLAELEFTQSQVTPRSPSLGEAGYGRLAISAPASFLPIAHSSHPGVIPGTGLVRTGPLEVVYLNSTVSCTHDVRPQHGDLGEAQYQWLVDTLPLLTQGTAVYRILLVHHHVREFAYPTGFKDFSVMQQADRLLKLCGQYNIDLILHGHRHHPYLQTFRETGFSQPCTILSAGSFSVGPQHRGFGSIPNLSHIIQLFPRHHNGSALGRVLTLKFNPKREWEPAASDDATGTTPEIWFNEPLGAKEALAAARTLITHLGAPSTLPVFPDLPIELRCLPLHKVDEVLESAAKAEGWTMSGGYTYRASLRHSGTPVILQ